MRCCSFFSRDLCRRSLSSRSRFYCRGRSLRLGFCRWCAKHLPCSAAMLTTTARLRPVALMTVAKRCAGDWIRKSSFENSSSLPGSFASASICATSITLAVNDAQLERELRVVLDPGGERLRQSDGDRRTYTPTDETPLQTLQSCFNLGALGRLRRELVLDDVIVAACFADDLAQLEVLRCRQTLEAANDRRPCCVPAPSRAFFTFSFFFALVNAMVET